MKPNRVKLTVSILIVGLLAMTGLFASRFVAKSFTSPAMRKSDPLVEQVKEIAGYRTWTKVNAEPQLMRARTANLCGIMLSPAGIDVDGTNNPHREKYITVYVNDAGRKSMMEQAKPSFPEGSVIVKEKLPDKSSQSPELLTVMIKRAKGFNPESGDWEYMVVDGTGTIVQAQGKLENCQSCHLAKPDTNYVFRTYLSDDTRNKMK